MSKKIEYTLRYPGATAEQVHAMLADTAFRERVLERQQVLSKNVTITESGETMSVRIDQTKETEGVPSFAKKFVGERTQILHEEEWSSPTDATVELRIPGKPGEITGDVHVSEDADGAQERVRLTITVKVPLVGGRIEDMVGTMLTEALRVEESTGKEWLA